MDGSKLGLHDIIITHSRMDAGYNMALSPQCKLTLRPIHYMKSKELHRFSGAAVSRLFIIPVKHVREVQPVGMECS